MRVRRSIRLDENRRVLLHHWGTADDHRLENIVCLDADGAEVWRAQLPGDAGQRDCFVRLVRDGAALLTETFTGRKLRLDPKTGRAV